MANHLFLSVSKLPKKLFQKVHQNSDGRSWKLLPLILLLLTFSLLAIAVSLFPTVTAWDSRILQNIHTSQSPELDQLAIALTNTARGKAIAAITILVSIGLVWRRQWRSLNYIWTVVIGSSLMTWLTKLLFHRDRPNLWVSPLPQSDFSFPSGHAIFSMSLVVAIALLIPQKHWRSLWLVTGGLWIGAIAWTRLYLGVHYPSDILGGWLLAIFLAIAVCYWHLAIAVGKQ